MKRRFLIAGAALALFGALPASAADTTVTDPNDSRGKLDLEEVRRSGDDRLTWRLITHGKWSVKQIWSEGFLTVDLDTRGDEHPDYYILIEPTHKRMEASLFRDRKQKDDYSIGKLKAWRKDKRSASVQLPMEKLTIGKDRTSYSWRVLTLFNGNERCRDVCFDLAPQGGAWVVEPLLPPVP